MFSFGRSISRLYAGRLGAVRLGSSCCPPPPSQEKDCSESGKQKALMEPACKIALVMGGTSGIGLAIAQQLLCCGLQKAILASNSSSEGQQAVDSLNKEFGEGKAVYYEVDVNSNSQFECLMKESLEKYNRIDIMVNNAGMLNDKAWELEIDTNLKATVRGMVLAMKYLAKNGECSKGEGGVVINVASMWGLVAVETAPVYSSTKHAVVGLTRSLGTKYHYADTGLRVIGLCPGVTKTKLVTDVEDKGLTPRMGIDTAKALASLPQQTSEEVGKAAVHLVKYGKSAACYLINGGELSYYTFPGLKEATTGIKSFR